MRSAPVPHLSRFRRSIDYFNATMAKAFKWNYKGKPLTI
jgi:hypothetical protein